MYAAHLQIFLQQKNTMSDITKHSSYKVTVSIVNFNTAHLLKQCIESIEKYVPNLVRIIIINHSTEKIILSKTPTPITIITQKNSGFGAGHNRAVAEIQNIVTVERLSEHIHLIFNPDAFLTQDITPLLTHFNDKHVAVVGPQLLDDSGAKDPHCTGAKQTFYTILCGKLRQRSLPTISTSADWVSGAAMLVRMDDFIDASGFDEKYFLYFEDIDLCTRIKTHCHKKIIFDPSISVTHNSGQSFSDKRTQKYHYDISQDLYFQAHHSQLHANIQKYLRKVWRKLF